MKQTKETVVLMKQMQESVDLETARELLIRNITFCINKCRDISLLEFVYKLIINESGK